MDQSELNRFVERPEPPGLALGVEATREEGTADYDPVHGMTLRLTLSR